MIGLFEEVQVGPPESVYFTVVDGAMPHLFCLKEVEIFAVKEGVFDFFLKILHGSKKLFYLWLMLLAFCKIGPLIGIFF